MRRGVTGDEEVGGLVGDKNVEVGESYWEIETTAQDENSSGTRPTT